MRRFAVFLIVFRAFTKPEIVPGRRNMVRNIIWTGEEMKVHFVNHAQKAMRYAFMALFLAFFPQSVAAGENAEWNSLIQELLANNPDIAALQKRVESLGPIPEAKMAWDDPLITIGLANVPTDTFDFGQEPMTQKTIGFAQRVPSAAVRHASREVAESDRVVAMAEKNLRSIRLIEKLRQTVNEIIFIRRALDILAENETILDEFVRIANSKYAAGKGIQANVIQAQVERSKLIDSRLELTEKLSLAKIRANRLLGRDPAMDFFAPAAFNGYGPEVKFDSLWGAAMKASPEITLARRNLERARSKVRKAESETGSNLTVSAMYGQRDDTPIGRPDFVSVNAAFSIPLWKSSKQEKYTASARFAASAGESRLDDAIQKVRADLKQAYVSVVRERDTQELYDTGLIPQAVQALESATVAYKLDNLDFLTLLSNEINLLKLELEKEKSILRQRNLAARIEALTGESLGFGDEK